MKVFVVNILDKYSPGSFLLGVYSTFEKASESFEEYQSQEDYPEINIVDIVERDLDDID